MTKLFGRLVITIEKASDLPNSDYFGGASDPYCIVALDGVEIGRTQVWPDESSPVWNQEFYINLNGEAETITFDIWDRDTARTDDLLSTVKIPVASLHSETSKDEIQTIHKEVDLISPSGEPAGSLSYSMKYFMFIFFISLICYLYIVMFFSFLDFVNLVENLLNLQMMVLKKLFKLELIMLINNLEKVELLDVIKMLPCLIIYW